MGTGDCDRAPGAGDGGEHLGPAQNGHTALRRRAQLLVAAGDRGRDRHRVDAVDVRRVVADVHLDTEAAQPLEVGGGLEIAARHDVAHAREHPGDGAHACAPDPHDVDAARRGEVERARAGGHPMERIGGLCLRPVHRSWGRKP